MTAAWKRWAELHLGRSLGLALLWTGLVQYRSWSSRVVLDRWSTVAAAAIAIVGLMTLASAIDSWRCARRSRARSGSDAEGRAGASLAWLELAFLLGGLAYCLAAFDDAEAGGRLLDLNLLGSHHPLAIGLEWLALVAAGIAAASLGWRKLRPRAPGLYMLLLSCGAIALAGEGIVRAINVIAPETQGFPTASTELWMRRHGVLNSLGYRDVEHALAKPPGALRILVVGDSFTFAMGVSSTEDRVSERLAQTLPDRLGRPVELINAGKPYTHTLQQTEALDALLPYAPDLILLLYVFNDIDYLRSSEKPSTALGDGQSLIGRAHPMRLLYLNSFLVQQIYLRARHVYWSLAPASERPVSAYEDPTLVGRHIADLARFVEKAGSQGAAVALVPFHPGFVHTGEGQRSRLDFLARAREAGLPFWPLENAFAGHDYAELVVNAMDHHPSALANRLLADALVEPIGTWAAGPVSGTASASEPAAARVLEATGSGVR